MVIFRVGIRVKARVKFAINFAEKSLCFKKTLKIIHPAKMNKLS